MLKLSPSILSADFMNLGDNIKILESQNTAYIHVDVMDGIFVPNITMGMPIINSLSKFTTIPLDVHLMVERPERYIDDFAECGSDIINIHYEACNNIVPTLERIRRLGKSPAITINPETDYKKILKYIEYVDMILIMSVKPGFGGQDFINSSLKKIESLANYISKNNLKTEIEIDGGINIENVKDTIDAGANIIVVGSSIFNKSDIGNEIKKYHTLFKEIEVNAK